MLRRRRPPRRVAPRRRRSRRPSMRQPLRRRPPGRRQVRRLHRRRRPKRPHCRHPRLQPRLRPLRQEPPRWRMRMRPAILLCRACSLSAGQRRWHSPRRRHRLEHLPPTPLQPASDSCPAPAYPLRPRRWSVPRPGSPPGLAASRLVPPPADPMARRSSERFLRRCTHLRRLPSGCRRLLPWLLARHRRPRPRRRPALHPLRRRRTTTRRWRHRLMRDSRFLLLSGRCWQRVRSKRRLTWTRCSRDPPHPPTTPRLPPRHLRPLALPFRPRLRRPRPRSRLRRRLRTPRYPAPSAS
jgi:hypothetical protein